MQSGPRTAFSSPNCTLVVTSVCRLSSGPYPAPITALPTLLMAQSAVDLPVCKPRERKVHIITLEFLMFSRE